MSFYPQTERYVLSLTVTGYLRRVRSQKKKSVRFIDRDYLKLMQTILAGTEY